METLTETRKLGTHEARRWAKDPMGFDVVRAMLRDGELSNKSWDSEIKADYLGWCSFTFVTVGNGALVLNHTERTLNWQS